MPLQVTLRDRGKYNVGRRLGPKKTYKKRTTIKGVRRRPKGANFAKKRRQFVEIKSRSHRELWESMGGTAESRDTVLDPIVPLHLTTTGMHAPQKLTYLPVWSYINPNQGFTEHDMVGQFTVPKFLKMKLSLRPPKAYAAQPAPGSVRDASPRLYVIHGWMTNPTNANAFTTPTREAMTRALFTEHMVNHISQKWKNTGRQNSLEFREQTQLDINVLGYKRIRNPKDDNISVPIQGQAISVGTSTTVGQQPVVEFSIDWKLKNRKVKYVKGTQGQVTDVDFYYPNDSWIPFVLIYQPDSDYQASGNDYSWTYAYNDKTWFSDS